MTIVTRYGDSGDLADADFLQFYNMNLSDLLLTDKIRAYKLAGLLPKESRSYEEMTGGEAFTWDRQIAANMHHFRRNIPEVPLPEHVKSAQAAALERNLEFKFESDPDSIRAAIYGLNQGGGFT